MDLQDSPAYLRTEGHTILRDAGVLCLLPTLQWADMRPLPCGFRCHRKALHSRRIYAEHDDFEPCSESGLLALAVGLVMSLPVALPVDAHCQAQAKPCAAVCTGSDGAQPLAYSIGTAAPGSRVHHILTATRAGRARLDMAAEELHAVAAAGGPSEGSEGASPRPAVPRTGSAAAGGLRAVGDTVRPVYGVGVVAPKDRIPRSTAPDTHPAASAPTLGVLSTDETAAKAARVSAAAAAAHAAAEPQFVEATVVVATAEDLPAAFKTAEKVQPVLVRLLPVGSPE